MCRCPCGAVEARAPGFLRDEFERADLGGRLRAFIDYWFYETFHGSPVSDHADVMRAVRDAVEDLKARIVDQI